MIKTVYDYKSKGYFELLNINSYNFSSFIKQSSLNSL